MSNITPNLPWVEKYRPSTLDELISHEDIIRTINRFIEKDQLPHLLLYGPPGTGKTSTILACAKKLYSSGQFRSMVLELNASDDRGINIVRGEILSFASTRTIFKSGFKLIILDEADAMTQDAQNALRRIIEKFTENVRFCIICNYLGKIIPALQSRCTRFRFGPLSAEQILPRLEYVIEQEKSLGFLPLRVVGQHEVTSCFKENFNCYLRSDVEVYKSIRLVNVTEDGKKALIELADGDMRRVLNVLQSAATAFPEVNEDAVYTCVGHPLKSDVTNILTWLLNDNFTDTFNRIEDLKINKGLALQGILTEVHKFLHRVELPPEILSELIIKMADTEYRLTAGTSEKIQLTALISAFHIARSKIKTTD